MLVSLTATATADGPDATDLGYLLHKHPDRLRTVEVSNGEAHVFFPEATPERCTATMLVEIDPIALSRRRDRQASAPTLEPYVNDRAYAASSLLSVALGKLFGTALSGTCEQRPALVDHRFDLTVELPTVRAVGGAELVQRLFAPLGWSVTCRSVPLDPTVEGWGDSQYLSVRLTGKQTVKAALAHLSVLLPVLDDRKHYWVNGAEIDKLLRRGEPWLADHPERDVISRRYLRSGDLTRQALARLTEPDPTDDPDGARPESTTGDHPAAEREAALEKPLTLNQQRLAAVAAAVVDLGGGSVVDLGCGEGRLLQRLLDEPSVTKLVGVDVSLRSLDSARRRLRLDQLSARRQEQIELLQGALTYRDRRLEGFDVACVVEVIEHLDAERLDVFAQVLFGQAEPRAVIMTTPNREFNVHFPSLPAGQFRHRDHRFEWTRAEFVAWATDAAETYGYTVTFDAIGPDEPTTGSPTQLGLFQKANP
jgi:3' terminal RNA ribose 2'-O-methyltransferase Hen1